MAQYKSVFWNELDQRMWRTTTSIGDVPVRYEYIGRMTRAEYDLLIEVLWEVFEDEKIKLSEFQRIFGDIRTFCDRVKKIVEEA
jgi:chemotaxis regulatin CheY-phosphate phosphatase CheZ